MFLQAFLVSTGFVALAEIGDKTQLLAIILAARFKRPWPIVWGILVATLANHFLAGALGQLLTRWLAPNMQWILGVSFIAMAVWLLVPDKVDEDDVKVKAGLGIFTATLVAFFLAEMGDKTQVATVALAAKYQALTSVVAGTTIGMLLANVPAVFLGEKIARYLPPKIMHAIAALIFAGLGLWAIFAKPVTW